MNRLARLATIALLAAPFAWPVCADEPDGPDEAALAPFYNVIPLSRAAELVAERFAGKLVSARLAPPLPHEAARGTQLVHEMRLLTADHHLLLIRIDAMSGRFLEVAGAGLVEARRLPQGRP